MEHRWRRSFDRGHEIARGAPARGDRLALPGIAAGYSFSWGESDDDPSEDDNRNPVYHAYLLPDSDQKVKPYATAERRIIEHDAFRRWG